MSATQKVDVRLPGGWITALSHDGIIRARGIRYAKASRFQKPEAILQWDKSQDCTTPGPICPQNPSRLQVAIGDIDRGRRQDEDCLRLTVAASTSTKAAPVLVFIHGGAYITGDGDSEVYSPVALAKKGVVGVSISYRLGVFGYLPIPGTAPPNLGLLDQLQALHWIQRNIQSFGGDPTNVTVMGQSAGADSIYCLMMTDEARNLFKRAIMESLPLAYRDENRAEMTSAMVEHTHEWFSEKDPGRVSATALLALQSALTKIASSKSRSLIAFAPLFGEYPLPAEDEALKRFLATCKEKSVLVGYTANEMTAFADPNTYTPPPFPTEQFHDAVDKLVTQIDIELGHPSPTFEFIWFPRESDRLKATHCIDLPFLLGDSPAWKDAPMLQGNETEAVVSIAGDSVKNLWVDFAKGQDLMGERFIIDAKFQYGRHK